MFIGKAIYQILIQEQPLLPVGTRIFPNVAPQTTQLPFIIYDVTGVTPTPTKENASTLDINDFTVSVYAETYSQAELLAKDVRSALDRLQYETYDEVIIQSINFISYNDIFDDTSGNAGVYRKAMDFELRQIRNTIA